MKREERIVKVDVMMVPLVSFDQTRLLVTAVDDLLIYLRKTILGNPKVKTLSFNIMYQKRQLSTLKPLQLTQRNHQPTFK